VRRVVGEAVERARSGRGPSIVENRTYRYRGHFEGDPQRYRTPEEVEVFKNREDPIRLFSERLKREKKLSERAEKEMIAGVARRIDEAVRYAREAPLPAPEEALQDLFVSGGIG
jgi:pyruvate dehydrogenase E1 component alpha subunit